MVLLRLKLSWWLWTHKDGFVCRLGQSCPRKADLMKVLGVNGSGATLWLALFGHDGPEDTEPYSLQLGDGSEGGLALTDLKAEARHVLTRLKPDLVVVLDPESNGVFKWKNTLLRVSAETMLVLAADATKIPVERVTRASVRSKLSLGRSGSLASHAKEAYPDRVGSHWAGKRDVAVLAAASRYYGGRD